MSFAIGILAAGSSTRLGQAKQLISIAGQSLLARQICVADALRPAEVMIAIGAHRAEMESELDRLQSTTASPLTRIAVLGFAEGMSASIRALVSACQLQSYTHLLLLLVDQYRVSAEHLRALLQCAALHADTAVASAHDGLCMPPAVFPASWFARLQELRGDQGAKSLLRQGENVIAVATDADLGDIDVPADVPIIEQIAEQIARAD